MVTITKRSKPGTRKSKSTSNYQPLHLWMFICWWNMAEYQCYPTVIQPSVSRPPSSYSFLTYPNITIQPFMVRKQHIILQDQFLSASRHQCPTLTNPWHLLNPSFQHQLQFRSEIFCTFEARWASQRAAGTKHVAMMAMLNVNETNTSNMM